MPRDQNTPMFQSDSNSNPIDDDAPRQVAEEASYRPVIRGHACGGGTQVSLLADINVNRKATYLYNASATRNLYVATCEHDAGLSITSGTVSYTQKILPGAGWTVPVKHRGKIWGVFDGALAIDEKVMVTEYQ